MLGKGLQKLKIRNLVKNSSINKIIDQKKQESSNKKLGR